MSHAGSSTHLLIELPRFDGRACLLQSLLQLVVVFVGLYDSLVLRPVVFFAGGILGFSHEVVSWFHVIIGPSFFFHEHLEVLLWLVRALTAL